MQSLGTLVEDGREDDISELPDDGGGMTERHRRRGHSRLSLASWLGFGGFGGSSSRDDNPGLGDSRAQSSFSVSTVHGFGPATTSTTRRGGEESRGKQVGGLIHERSTRGPAAVSRTDSSASTGSASRKPRGGRLRDLSSIIVGSRRARRDADEARERREAGGGASKDMHSKRYVPSDADSDEEAGRLLVDEYFIELEEEMETPPESTSTITPSSAATTVVDGRKMRDCPLCFVRRPEAAFPRLVGCEHRSCSTCLIQYVQLEVMENRVEVRCPECPALLLPSDVAMLLRPLGDDLIKKYEEFSLRRYLISEADTRWCPAPDCGYAVIATACAACPQLRCERAACGTLFCYHCKDIWHDSETCDEARRQRGIMAGIGVSAAAEAAPRRGILSFRNSSGVRRASSRLNSEATVLKPGDIKACPRCRAYIVKMDDGSCNHMVCTMCSTEFCWLCLKEISDLHYLSPTGCTFWGKKPWTRKKKLLWQLGTLIGAPLGIALIAGLSVPGIIFGVPVLVGRKVHHRFLHHSKARRRLVTAACVAGSLVVSPVLAVMAVGVGVPIMLAYVYGVVPLSLCRNGGCGLGERERRRDSDELEALLNGHGIEEVQEEGGIEETSVEMPVPFVVSPAPALVSIGIATGCAEEDEDLSDDIFLAGAESAGDSARASAGSVAVSDAEKSILLEASARDSATEKRGWRKAEGRGDGASLAPATSLHSGLSVCTRGGKSFADSENSATMTKGRHRRPSCESGGVTSVNYDEASTKALAGSQYHYDDKSVHTLGSQAPEMLSYCDDVASTKALAGSVLDAKSLSGSLGATLASHDGCPNAQCACQSTPSTSGGGGGEKSGQGFHAWLDKSHRRSVSSTRAKSHSSSAFERPVHWRDEMVTTSPEKSPSIEHSTTTAEVHFSADGEGQERERPAARGKHGPSTSRDSERSVAGPSTAAQSHIDPFKIRALMDNMKLMVASDVEIDADDYYRAETRSSRRADSGAADAASSRSGGVITAQPLPEEAAAGPLHITQTPPPPPLADASTSTSIDALAASSSSATKPSSPPSRRVRWLANLFGSKKNKN